jgi:PKD repeat protein
MKKILLYLTIIISISCNKGTTDSNNLQPLADFTFTASPNFAAPATVYFANKSTNADTYKWDFGNGQTSTEKNPSVTYTVNGTYTVKLTVNAITIPNVSSIENTSTQIITIVLPPNPTADFELLGLRLTSIGAIPNNYISTLNKSANGKSTWDFGDGTSPVTAGNPIHYFRNPGTYTVTLKVFQSLTNTTVTASKNITIYEIGQQLFGGKIFYSDSAGKCLIAAPSDLQLATWGCPTTLTNITDNTIFSGKINTQKIISQCGNTTAAFVASNPIINGYSDWYLPSKIELEMMYENRVKIGGFTNLTYWSSTEVPNQANSAYSSEFNPTSFSSIKINLKTDSYRVRPVRSN